MNEKVTFVEAGFDANGTSTILETRQIEKVMPMPEVPSFSITDMYYVNDMPLTTQTERKIIPYDINLSPQALRFLICRIPPIDVIIKEWNNPEVQSAEDFIKFGMHKTLSVDYFYISKGAVTLYMGNGDTYDFKEGDAYAMRGADHAWINYGDCICELVGVMIGVTK